MFPARRRKILVPRVGEIRRKSWGDMHSISEACRSPDDLIPLFRTRQRCLLSSYQARLNAKLEPLVMPILLAVFSEAREAEYCHCDSVNRSEAAPSLLPQLERYA